MPYLLLSQFPVAATGTRTRKTSLPQSIDHRPMRGQGYPGPSALPEPRVCQFRHRRSFFYASARRGNRPGATLAPGSFCFQVCRSRTCVVRMPPPLSPLSYRRVCFPRCGCPLSYGAAHLIASLIASLHRSALDRFPYSNDGDFTSTIPSPASSPIHARRISVTTIFSPSRRYHTMQGVSGGRDKILFLRPALNLTIIVPMRPKDESPRAEQNGYKASNPAPK